MWPISHTFIRALPAVFLFLLQQSFDGKVGVAKIPFLIWEIYNL
jgi:hypothetical protein